MIQWNSMIPKYLMIQWDNPLEVWTLIIQKSTVIPPSSMVLFNLFFTFGNACLMSLSNLSLNDRSVWLSWIFFNNRAVSVTSDRVLFNRLTKVEMTKKGYTIIGGGGGTVELAIRMWFIRKHSAMHIFGLAYIRKYPNLKCAREKNWNVQL